MIPKKIAGILLVLSLIFTVTGCASKSENGGAEMTSYHYKDVRFDFTVDYPSEWMIDVDSPAEATEVQEASPTGGVKLYPGNDKSERIYVYGQNGHIGTDYPGYEHDKIKTEDGVSGDLYIGEADGTMYLNLVLGDGFYGANANISKDQYKKNEKSIMNIFKSIKIHGNE